MDMDGDGHPDFAFGGDLDLDGPEDHGGDATWDAVVMGFCHDPDNDGPDYYNPYHYGHQQGSGGGHANIDHGPLGVPDVAKDGGRRVRKMAGAGPAGSQTGDKPAESRPNMNTRIFAVHVAAHSPVDVVRVVEQLGKNLGVIRIDTVRPNMNGARDTKLVLADNDPWNEPYDLVNKPPAGYIPGLTGMTTFIKQAWQVGVKKGIGPITRALSNEYMFDKDAMTYIELGIVSWYFKETSDYSTLVIIKVVSLPVWDTVYQAWGYKVKPFEKHHAAAKVISQGVLDALKAAKPTSSSLLLRELAYSRAGMPKPSEEPTSPGEPVPPPDDSEPIPPPVPNDGGCGEGEGLPCGDAVDVPEHSGANLDDVLAMGSLEQAETATAREGVVVEPDGDIIIREGTFEQPRTLVDTSVAGNRTAADGPVVITVLLPRA